MGGECEAVCGGPRTAIPSRVVYPSCLPELNFALAQSGQRVGQVERVLAGEGHALTGAGWSKPGGARAATGESDQFGAKARVSAVGQVTAAGVAQRGEVHTNLVSTSGFQVHLYQGCGAEGFEHIVVGDGVASVFNHGELPFVAGVAADGCVDGAAQRVGQALHEGVVDLVHGAFLEARLSSV